MGLLNFFRKNDKKVYRTRPRTMRLGGGSRSVRSFLSGESDDLFANFKGNNLSSDEELVKDLVKMRGRSRKICNDSPIARKYLEMCKINIIGEAGISLSIKADSNETVIDKSENETVLAGWAEWGKRKTCTANGLDSWIDVCNTFIETTARDGECFIRLIRGFHNKFGFALQLIEGDALDVELNQELSNGNRINLGVEKDPWGRPVAYYFKTRKSGESVQWYAFGRYERVPADDIIHGFKGLRPNQSRGYPWLNTAIRSLKMMDGWLEAELTGARIAASKMGFYTSEDGSSQFEGDDVDDDGTLVTEVTAGSFEKLPKGVGFETFDAKYPNTEAGDFVKLILRQAAAGLVVAYNSLSGDLESVSFSSMRSGALEERANWRVGQAWTIETLCARVHEAWLVESMLRNAFDKPVRPSRMASLLSGSEWNPRGWSWVDPKKDLESAAIALSLGLTTRKELTSGQGKNYETIFAQLEKENLLAATHNVSVVGKEKTTTENGNNNEPEEGDE